MLYAPISPVTMADVVTECSPYLMALPSMADVDPEYARLYRSVRRNGAFVMLDNGLSERKTPLRTRDLVRYINLIDPSEVILPDYLNDAGATLEAARMTADVLGGHGQRRLMGVPQGNDLDEYLDCVYAFVGMPFINAIGISKYFPQITGQTRARFLEEIRKAGLHRRRSLDWHLLGLAEDLDEVAQLALDYPWVRGMDTCYPALASMMGLDIRESRQIVTSPEGFETADPLAYWPGDKEDNTLWELLMTNLNVFQQACRGRTF